MVAPRQQPPLLALVDELLAEQSRLQTPAARASIAHDQFSNLRSQISNYQSLIPLTAPGPGEQYAFEVDLDSCSGCKACVVACHSLNGLDDDEAWRDVGLITGGSRAAPYQQTVTTACHHCADPGCLNGCPVLAYEKDPITGIVRHLDDQCIGCQYCVLKCPYDVPKYNERLGIVRKCDLCHQRLAVGEAPACAQACPTHAIRIVTVSLSPVPSLKPEISSPESQIPDPKSQTPNSSPQIPNLKSQIPNPAFLAAAPDPSYTQPTTRYLTRRPVPVDTLAADALVLRPQPPHWPLVALLMLMPMAIGCGVADLALDLKSPALAVTGWLAGTAGLALASLHLGQPLRAWRVFLGLRKSWFSREAVVFGAWFPLATAGVAVRLGWLPLPDGPFRPALALATALTGLLGLFCSVMIYVDTRRLFWRFAHTAPRFFGSAAVLGLAAALTAPDAPRSLGLGLVAVTLLKLAFETRALSPLQELWDGTPSPARQTARLITGPLRDTNALRLAAALFGGILLPLMIALGATPLAAAWPALALCLGGELAERTLFFRAVDAPKMPGQAGNL